MVDMSSQYHYGKINTYNQYRHVIGNMRMNAEQLRRLVTNKPYDFEVRFDDNHRNWDANRERHIKDLSWAINVQVGWLMQYASTKMGKFWIRLDDAKVLQYIVENNGKSPYGDRDHQERLEYIARKYGFASCAAVCEEASCVEIVGEWAHEVVGI